ncbi:hypothetical protein ES702_03096 [subsurface metagenome]
MNIKRVEISQAAFSKILIDNGEVVAVTEKLRKNMHKLLDAWLDKVGYPNVDDGIIFKVVEDRTGKGGR